MSAPPVELTFIVDMNEIEDEDLIPIAMDFTRNYGPGVCVTDYANPLYVGRWVRIFSPDDDAIYWAVVERVVSDRDFIARVDWDSGQNVGRPVDPWQSSETATWTASQTDTTSAASIMQVSQTQTST